MQDPFNKIPFQKEVPIKGETEFSHNVSRANKMSRNKRELNRCEGARHSLNVRDDALDLPILSSFNSFNHLTIVRKDMDPREAKIISFPK